MREEEAMKLICPTCNASYKIPDDTIPSGRRAVATCKRCGGKIVIEPGPERKLNYGTRAEPQQRHATPSPQKPPPYTAMKAGEFEFIRENGNRISPETHSMTTHESLPQYFSVSKPKLIVMSLCTWSIYQVYWFYKNWKIIRERTGENVRPFWRAFFAIFFCYGFFKSVRQSASSLGIPFQTSPGGLACAYIALAVMGNLPNPFWLVSFLTFLPLLSVQGVINQINSKGSLEHEPNNRFSLGNVVIIVFGGLVLLLCLIGAFLPAQIETSGMS
jgi:predicted Zn finger-like uncharacterized protein